jgi:hypothetical protein
LNENRVKLISTKEGELTKGDLATDIKAFFGAFNMREEILKTATRSLEQKIQFAKLQQRWLGKIPAYGYDKICYAADGKILWILHYLDKQHRLQYFPDDNGNFPRSKAVVRNGNDSPKKSESDKLDLIYSLDAKRKEAVEIIVDFTVNRGMSLRKIAHYLNARGYRINGRFFCGNDVRDIILKPVYMGSYTYNMKTYAEVVECKNGKVVGVPEELVDLSKNQARKPEAKSEDDWIIKDGHYPAIVTPEQWKEANRILKSRTRDDLPHRNDRYCFKGLVICGHCGKPMLGTASKRGESRYTCQSYLNKHSTGVATTDCAKYWVAHENVEKILKDELKKLQVEVDTRCEEQQIEELSVQVRRHQAEAESEARAAFVDYLNLLRQDHPHDIKLQCACKSAERRFFKRVRDNQGLHDDMVTFWGEVNKDLGEVEALRVVAAQRKLVDLKRELAQVTEKWVKASAMQLPILEAMRDKLEAQIRQAEAQTVTQAERQARYQAERQAKLNAIAEARAALENAEKATLAQAVRRAIHGIRFFFTVRQAGKLRKAKLSHWRVDLCENADSDLSVVVGGQPPTTCRSSPGATTWS